MFKDDDDDGEDWKKPTPEDNPRNSDDFPNKVILNVHSNIPWSMDQWKVVDKEQMRADIFHKGTYFSFVMAERPYVEIFQTDQYGNLVLPPDRVFDLGPYFNANSN